jgi:malonate transporter
MLATFAIGFLADCRRPVLRRNRLSGAAIEGLSAGYANTAFIGIPLCLGVFGPAGLPPVMLATLLTVCLLFAFSIVLVELDQQAGQSVARTLLEVSVSTLLNPLVAAPLAGAAVNVAGLALAAPVERFTSLLGAAASPCALVTIGLFLAGSGRAPVSLTQVSLIAVSRVVAAKLLLQPALTAILAVTVFRLDPLWTRAAVLIAALPVGTGPFMLARLYRREADVVSRATLISTVLSLVTVSLLLAWIG